MKKIIYTRPDGGLSFLNPSEGARMAWSVLLANGTVLGIRAELRSEGVEGKKEPVDHFLRGWPVVGTVVEWAETEEEFVERIAWKDVPADALNVQIVEDSIIPTDRTFRNAWKAGFGTIEHDMPRARDIKRDQLRVLRKPLMEALDVAYMRADEMADLAEKRRIAAKKQALRDMTEDKRIEEATTPEQLKEVIPDILK